VNPVLAWSLLFTSVASFVVFGWYFVDVLHDYARQIRRYRHDHTRPLDNTEHGLVVISALVVISGANVLIGTTFIEQTHDDDPSLVLGAVIVRGALLATAIYLLVRHPKADDE
jgi:hypothetical protein